MKRYLVKPLYKGFTYDYSLIGIIDHCSIVVDEKTLSDDMVQRLLKKNRISIKELQEKPLPKGKSKLPKKDSAKSRQVEKKSLFDNIDQNNSKKESGISEALDNVILDPLDEADATAESEDLEN